MKVRYKYPIKEAKQQQAQLAKLFDCVRIVWNDSLVCC